MFTSFNSHNFFFSYNEWERRDLNRFSFMGEVGNNNTIHIFLIQLYLYIPLKSDYTIFSLSDRIDFK